MKQVKKENCNITFTSKRYILVVLTVLVTKISVQLDLVQGNAHYKPCGPFNLKRLTLRERPNYFKTKLTAWLTSLSLLSFILWVDF